MRYIHDVFQFRFFSETDNFEIGTVRAHDQTGRLGEGFFVIMQVHAIGRAYLDQLRAGLFHYIWHTEATANLDQLRTGDNGTLAIGQRRQRQQDR